MTQIAFSCLCWQPVKTSWGKNPKHNQYKGINVSSALFGWEWWPACCLSKSSKCAAFSRWWGRLSGGDRRASGCHSEIHRDKTEEMETWRNYRERGSPTTEMSLERMKSGCHGAERPDIIFITPTVEPGPNTLAQSLKYDICLSVSSFSNRTWRHDGIFCIITLRFSDSCPLKISSNFNICWFDQWSSNFDTIYRECAKKKIHRWFQGIKVTKYICSSTPVAGGSSKLQWGVTK